MSVRQRLILVWMVAGLQVIAAGQNPPSPDTAQQGQPPSGTSDAGDRSVPAAALSAVAGMQGDGGDEDPGSGVPQIPALLGGKGISSAFLSEMERSNYLRGGVNVGATYDDNPLLAPTGQSSNTSESIFPNLKIEQSTSRMRWSLGYAGGLTVNQNITSQNQGSHNLNFDSQFRLSPHVNLRVAENFALTTGFFDSGNGGGVIGSGGPNASLITPLATQRSNITTVETNYHFALNDVVGASGSFYDLHYTNVPSNLPAGTQLTDSQTATASAFWLHRLFRGNWGGASYAFERLTFSPGGGETRVHSFFVVDTVNLSKRLTLTGFVGPQYSKNQGGGIAATQSTNLSVAAGVDGGWQDVRASVSAGYSRSISDGGGILGAVLLQNVHASFRRELVPGWAATVTAIHGTNQSIGVTSSSNASSINLTSAGVSLERNVGKSVGFRLGYSHDFQQQFGSPVQTFNASKNRFFVTLSYQWAKPLGM
jgi:hypothetical protein